jgi:hypothetical protein
MTVGVDCCLMPRLAGIVWFVAALIFASPAGAAAGFRMYGQDKPRHWKWAREAQKNVPLPQVRITIAGEDMLGGASYHPSTKTLRLPKPGFGGWTYWDERVLFLHELGHAFDFRHLDRFERVEFRALAGTSCSWLSTRCFLVGYPRKATYNVPPAEMFAEAYSACALGMTLEARDEVPSVSYGWEPPEGSDSALCDLIRRAAQP